MRCCLVVCGGCGAADVDVARLGGAAGDGSDGRGAVGRAAG